MKHITYFERLNGAAKHRAVSDKGVDLIKWLGFLSYHLFCPADYPTIGYGHAVKDGEDFSAGIDETQAEELLRQDAMITKRTP